ncbi:MAG: (2Fe-2S) ferredoxin domain-containing protein [Lentisphaeria bacterium]|nr:(2Fe-2S) ferredoxin domain-containing protein [Lentisphaeria bacterium]
MKNLDELRRIRDEVRKSMELRSGGNRGRITVCMGTCGIAAGARDTMKAVMDALEQADITDIAVTAAGCAGYCDREPMLEVEMETGGAVRYGNVDAAAAERIVREHIVGGQVLTDLVF